MRRILVFALRVASVPVGIGVGIGTAHITPNDYQQCPVNGACLLMRVYLTPTFATWQSVLFGAGAAAVLLLLSLAVASPPTARSLNASGVAAAATGVGLGLWMASLQALQQCPSFAGCPSPNGLVLQPTFNAWQCALFGAGSAAAVLLISLAMARTPRETSDASPLG